MENANGFKLNEFGVEELVDAINTAKDVYFNDKEKWLKLMENAYNTDNSWEKRIENYVEFYKEIGDNNE